MSHDDTARPGFRELEEVRQPSELRRAPTALEIADSVAGPPGGGVIDRRRLVAAVWRFKWIVVFVTVLGTMGGVGLSRFVRPTYRARATLWVDVPDMRSRDQGPIQSTQLVGSSGWIELLESHFVLDDVVHDLRLFLSWETLADSVALESFSARSDVRPGTYRLAIAPEGGKFMLSTRAGNVLQRGTVGDSVGASVGFVWQPPAAALRPGHTIEFTIEFPAGVAARLATNLRVRTDLLEGKVGNFMTVELRGSSASRVTDVVNAIAERFVVVATDLRRRKLNELVEILGDQVQHSQHNLAAAERALRDFRVRTVTVLLDEPAPVFTSGASARDPALASFFDMKASREQLRSDRLGLERILAQPADMGLLVDALWTIGSVQNSAGLEQALRELTEKQAALRALRYRYSDEHLPVRRLLADIATLEGQTIPTMVRALVAQLAAREADQGRRVDSIASGLRRIPPLAIEEARLQRDVTIAEQLFANTRQRYEEARLAEVSSIPEVRILDRAIPPEAPLFNAGPLLIGLAFLGSSLAGVLGVVVFDRLDARVRYPDQVTRTLGLPILGVVPHVSRRNGNGSADGVAPVIEALRGIRLALVHSRGAPGPLTVTVTSPGRGDGKSFVTSNLALAFAEAGYRTLIIDGDMRRGGLHRVLNLNRQPGLAELLEGAASREQVIQPAGYPSLWFIGCGARTRFGSELLTSAPMAELVTSLRPSYDAIFVDSPPLAAGVDAFALGTMTGAMLLVLRAGYSNGDLAEAKLGVLDRLPVRVLGAVLNDVRLTGDYRYYSYHLAGYEPAAGERWVGRPVLQNAD